MSSDPALEFLQEAHSQTNRDRLLAPARARIRSKNILVKGSHFDYGNGFHGSVYCNPHELLKIPAVIWEMARALIDTVPYQARKAKVVAGPMTGGAILAHTIAGLLDSERDVSDPPTIFVPFHQDTERKTDSGLYLKDFYRDLCFQKTVWIVDDVRNTGQTLEMCKALVRLARGEVVATSVILERQKSLPSVGVPHSYIESFDDSANYPAASCPMCQADIPITRF